MINRKMKKIDLLEFKRDTDSSESYYQDMWKVSEKQHTPILNGSPGTNVRSRVGGRKIFWIGKEDGKKIIHRLGHTLLNEYEKHFANYWRHTFGTPISLL